MKKTRGMPRRSARRPSSATMPVEAPVTKRAGFADSMTNVGKDPT